MGDKLSNEQMLDFLDTSNAGIPVYFEEYKEEHDAKIAMVLAKGLPVTVKTNKTLPHWMLEAFQKVPHCGIHASINFLEGSIKDVLEPDASDIFDLREMLALAKSWKIFTSLSIDYLPHLANRLDIYEIVTVIKNYVSHIWLHCPSIPDEYYHDYKSMWEALKPSSLEKFKQYYAAEVPTRMWTIKTRHMSEFTSELTEFLKGKKVSLETYSNSSYENSDNRVRYVSSGLTKLPLGIRPFFYEKDNGIFREVESVEGSTCQRCEKVIFN